MNMKRCILDPKLMRQLMSALLCQGVEKTVQARGTPIALVLWEDDMEMRDKKLGKTWADTEKEGDGLVGNYCSQRGHTEVLGKCRAVRMLRQRGATASV